MPVAKLMCKCGCKKYQLREKIAKYPYGNFYDKSHADKWIDDKYKRDTAKKLSKVKQVRAKEVKANKKAVIELDRKTLKWQHKQTQSVFNKLRRLQELKWFSDRGLEPLCISCQKPIGNDQWCNGHFKSVGAKGSLRYDFKNSYLQHNRNCNMAKSGDIEGYKKGLVARFGEDEGASVIDYCETHNEIVKYTWQDLESLRSEFNKKIRELT